MLGALFSFIRGPIREVCMASKKGNLIPLYQSIFSNHFAPVLAYRCLVKEDDRDAPSFLFGSVEPGSKDSNVGRYNAIGAQPSIEIVAKENMVTILDHREGCRTEEIVEDPMTLPRRIMEGWTLQLVDELRITCFKFSHSAWVGYFSYDTVHYAETKKLPFASAPPDDRNLPDVHLGPYDDVIVFDHVEKDSSLKSEEYKEAVLKAKDTHPSWGYISDCLELVFPEARGCILVASSPEILTPVEKRTITNRPLAGTV